jgi:hypothetical protein
VSEKKRIKFINAETGEELPPLFEGRPKILEDMARLESRNKLLLRVLEAAEVFMKIAYRKTNECIDLEDAVRAARENEKEG